MRANRWLGSLLAAGLAAACTNLTPPDDVNPTVSPTPVRPTAGFFEWRIPKTVLETTVSYVYKGCKPDLSAPSKVKLNTEVTVEIEAKGIADDNPFGDHSGAWIRVPMSEVQSFWQDRSLSIKKSVNGTLASITSTPTNNVGAIIGSVITTAAKVAAVGLGVPAAGGDKAKRHQQCSPGMEALLKRADDLDALIKSGTLSQKQVSDKAGQLQTLQAQLTITAKRTIDPGVSAIIEGDEAPLEIDVDGTIAQVRPQLKKLNQWVVGDQIDIKPFIVTLHLEFDKASPSIVQRCPGAAEQCPHKPVRIDRETHFREPAHIPIKVVRGVAAEFEGNRPEKLDFKLSGDAKGGEAIAFAQFGLPRAVPIGAGLFQKFNVQLSFDQFGGTTDQLVASDAVGTRATSFLSAGATAANSVATENRTAITQPDAETLKAQAEAARLNARIALAKARSDYNDLRAQGKVP